MYVGHRTTLKVMDFWVKIVYSEKQNLTKIKSSQKDENSGRKENRNREGSQPELRHLKGQCMHSFHLTPDETRLVRSDLAGGVQGLAGSCVRIKEPVQSVKST
jgi:hypothetical protein